MKRHTVTVYEYEPQDMEVWTILGPVQLNHRLAIQQQITPENLDRIKVLHQHMAICKFQASVFAQANARFLAREYAKKVDLIDAELQLQWRFLPDPSRRYHWSLIPACRCCHNLSKGIRLIDPSCIYHGAPVYGAPV
jgi:hypothetical protein